MIRLLAIDDEAGICDLLKRQFSPIGYEFYSATSAEDALSVVKEKRPQLVFLDVIMPGMSGLEVLKKIKQLDKNTKVIMITIADDQKTKAQANSLGADAFIRKPFSKEYLENTVIELVSELIGTRKKQEA